MVRCASGLILLLVSLSAACGSAAPARSAPAPSSPASAAVDDPRLAEWRAWRELRRESLAGPDGWLTLIGLHWLESAETTIGADPSGTIVLPADRSPARVGRLVLEGSAARFVPDDGADITVDDRPVTAALALVPDDPGPPTILAVGSLRMHLIARAGRLALRVKDRESAARTSFSGIAVFDHDPRYRVPARFTVAEPGEVLPIVNVLGQQVDEPLAGRVRFDLEGQCFELLATADGVPPEEGLFVMIRDATGDTDETYPAGRYLEIAQPDASGATTIDFNYAYTPPCAYTPLATCPLPPPENELPIAIRAGERAPAAH